jgi:hypothetical protein
MKSLLILSFPRSSSSLLAQIAYSSLSAQLRFPAWPSGEVLHHKHNRLSDIHEHDVSLERWDDFKSVLDIYKDSYLIKDVNQPFICQRYIESFPEAYNVLFINRPLTDNIYCMFKAGWFWPLRGLYASEQGSEIKSLRQTLKELRESCGIGRSFVPQDIHFNKALPVLVDACIHIDKACYQGISNVISFRDFITQPNVLFSKLEAFGYSPVRKSYLTDEFLIKRKQVLNYRNDPLWHVIDGLLRDKLKDHNRPR